MKSKWIFSQKKKHGRQQQQARRHSAPLHHLFEMYVLSSDQLVSLFLTFDYETTK